jgi:hypothetical protein
MNWELVLKRNGSELLQLVLAMLAGLRALSGGAATQEARLSLLRMLRPVEAALRRLIVIAARGMVAKGRLSPVSSEFSGVVGAKAGIGVFALFDPRKRFGTVRRGTPVLTVIGWDTPARESAVAMPVGFEAIGRRIAVLRAALEDLPGQARRLARFRARRALRAEAGRKVGPASPMRPGWPPGYRVRNAAAVHELLLDCDTLARRVENERVCQ